MDGVEDEKFFRGAFEGIRVAPYKWQSPPGEFWQWIPECNTPPRFCQAYKSPLWSTTNQFFVPHGLVTKCSETYMEECNVVISLLNLRHVSGKLWASFSISFEAPLVILTVPPGKTVDVPKASILIRLRSCPASVTKKRFFKLTWNWNKVLCYL